MVPNYWDGGTHSPRAVIAKVGKEDVGWIGFGERWAADKPSGVFLKAEREVAVYAALGEEMWLKAGSRNISVVDGQVQRDDVAFTHYRPTKLFRDLRARLSAFHASGSSRGVLLLGQPGTGKSLGARHMARELGVSSVCVDIGTLRDENGTVPLNGSSKAMNTDQVIKIFRPDVLIIDDVDRVGEHFGASLLRILELALQRCRFVILSANSTNKMVSALTRPGRIDDVVEVGPLDLDVVEDILGPAKDVAHLVADLPAAYVLDFAKRITALGKEAAVAEVAALRDQASAVAQRVEEENAGPTTVTVMRRRKG